LIKCARARNVEADFDNRWRGWEQSARSMVAGG
jgi:hypothetical protein